MPESSDLIMAISARCVHIGLPLASGQIRVRIKAKDNNQLGSFCSSSLCFLLVAPQRRGEPAIVVMVASFTRPSEALLTLEVVLSTDSFACRGRVGTIRACIDWIMYSCISKVVCFGCGPRSSVDVVDCARRAFDRGVVKSEDWRRDFAVPCAMEDGVGVVIVVALDLLKRLFVEKRTVAASDAGVLIDYNDYYCCD